MVDPRECQFINRPGRNTNANMKLTMHTTAGIDPAFPAFLMTRSRLLPHPSTSRRCIKAVAGAV
jgi:hypothetical protein